MPKRSTSTSDASREAKTLKMTREEEKKRALQAEEEEKKAQLRNMMKKMKLMKLHTDWFSFHDIDEDDGQEDVVRWLYAAQRLLWKFSVCTCRRSTEVCQKNRKHEAMLRFFSKLIYKQTRGVA